MKLAKYVISLILPVGFLIFIIYNLKVNYPELITKYKVITLKGDTFDMDVTVLITEDVAFATKYVKENSDSTVTTKDFDARAVSFPINEGRSPIIWIATTEDRGVIAHEIFHTALNVMYWTGMELNSETEEAFAYEVQHLTNSFYNQINIIQ
jgi:hypothetical protein